MNNSIDGVNYGPLTKLVGKWIGEKGLDIAPDANGDPDNSPFSDELTFKVSGPAENAEEQQLVSLRYHHLVRKRENGHIFHDQIGHWIFEPSSGLLMHSLTIPRAVCVLAGGSVEMKGDETIFEVKAKAGSETFGIIQSPFMTEKAKTTAFHMRLSLKGDEINYEEITSLHIYGKDFEHVDKSRLKRVTYDLG